MTLSWAPVVSLDIAGSALMVVLACSCAVYARQLTRQHPDDIFHNYLFLFTLAIVFFALSRSFGHLVKQLLLLNDMQAVWRAISPLSGAINSTTFVVIFALGIYFRRVQVVYSEIEFYKNNLEEMIEIRTEELATAKHTLENILNNSNPICITGIDFDVIQANAAYYEIWPRKDAESEPLRCYDSRPGAHCHTELCPLIQIIAGSEEVTHEVTKRFGETTREFIVTGRPYRDIDGRLLGMVESFQDITLRKQAETAMRESEERFRQIFESNPQPVILARFADFKIIDVNHAFCEETTIPRHMALGKSPTDISLWSEPELNAVILERLQQNGEINQLEAEYKMLDGTVRTGQFSARLLNPAAQPCILLVIRDITTEKAAERSLLDMGRMKNEFISMAAHELNTPLSAMMGYTEFLRNPEQFGEFSEEQKQEFIDEIYDRGDALSRIIEDLLDISRIESGTPIPLVLKKNDLYAILRRNIRIIEHQQPEHPITLQLPETLQTAELRLDRHRMNQALENLLSNAAKYSPKGSEIIVSADKDETGWTVKVEDHGIGMSAEAVERVFDKFYRADASNTAVGGLGLGMSIVRQIIEAHGGTIAVSSVPGQGTTVTFTLPHTT